MLQRCDVEPSVDELERFSGIKHGDVHEEEDLRHDDGTGDLPELIHGNHTLAQKISMKQTKLHSRPALINHRPS